MQERAGGPQGLARGVTGAKAIPGADASLTPQLASTSDRPWPEWRSQEERWPGHQSPGFGSRSLISAENCLPMGLGAPPSSLPNTSEPAWSQRGAVALRRGEALEQTPQCTPGPAAPPCE